jgi:hypothetical protein
VIYCYSISFIVNGLTPPRLPPPTPLHQTQAESESSICVCVVPRHPSSVKPKRHPPPVPRAPNSLPDRRLSSSETARHKPIARTPKNPIFYRAISLIFIDGKKSPPQAVSLRGKKSLFGVVILPLAPGGGGDDSLWLESVQPYSQTRSRAPDRKTAFTRRPLPRGCESAMGESRISIIKVLHCPQHFTHKISTRPHGARKDWDRKDRVVQHPGPRSNF